MLLQAESASGSVVSNSAEAELKTTDQDGLAAVRTQLEEALGEHRQDQAIISDLQVCM